MFDKTKKEMLESDRHTAIMVILANISDKLTKMIDIMLEKQAKTALFSTKTSHSTKPLITKEDYD